MNDLAIEIFNRKRHELEEQLKPHQERTCECHISGDCTCEEEYTPLGMSALAVEGWHCISDFLLTNDLQDLT